MATREENLKKINSELEKLSDEQLEQVAGGLAKELAIGRQIIKPTPIQQDPSPSRHPKPSPMQ